MLAVSHPEKEGVFQGSKWLKFQLLCDVEELSLLFNQLATSSLFLLTGVNDGKPIPQAFFLEKWGKWIDGLKRGEIPSTEELRTLFASVLTDDLNALWLQEVTNGYLLKLRKPVVHLQAHFFTYSSVDRIFRPMSMGQGSIFWGIQFSWPQIYQDPKSMQFCETGREFIFEVVRNWVREVSRPVPFLVDGEKIFSSIRLGKQCFSWIARHPQLTSFGVEERC